LNNARRNHNLVMLPDGKILCVGGNKWGDDGRNVPGDNYVAPVLTPEILDPSAQSPAWVEHAPMTAPRRYHSTALLLPDARVLVAGGNFYASMQIFSPPYLDGSPSRIAITSAPSTISYSTSFDITVSVPSGKSVNKVSLIRLGSVTHGFDQDQRYLQLLYTLPIPPTGTVHVTPPANAKYAPPGYYMLWVLDNSGVPCAEAKIVKLQ
jgi:galactose oxidase